MRRKVAISILITFVILFGYVSKVNAEMREIKNNVLWVYFLPTDVDMDQYTNNNNGDNNKQEVDLSDLPVNVQNEITRNAITDYEVSDQDYRYDILGYVANGWKSTTFSNGGYATFLQVDNYKPVQLKFDNTIEHQIQNDINCTFVNNGNFVKIEYVLKNKGNKAATITLGTQADVQISADDLATLTRMDNNMGVNLIDDRNNIQFKFYGKGVENVTDIDNLWIGTYPEHEEHFFANNNISKIENIDSAFTFSWKNRVIQPNETQRYSILIGIGEMSSVPKLQLNQTNKYYFNPNNVIVSGSVEDSDQNSKVVLHYKVDDGAEKTSSTYILDNNKLDFNIDLSSESLSEGTHNIRVWAVDNQGNISNFTEKEFTLTSISQPLINMTEEWSNKDVKFIILDSETNKEKVSRYQYKIDENEWTDIELSTSQLALNDTGTCTVYARAISKDGSVISDTASKTARVDKIQPIITDTIVNKTITIEATDEHSGLKDIEYLLNYKESTSNTDRFTTYTAPLTDIRADNQKIYLHIRAHDNAGNIATSEKSFEVPTAALIESEKIYTNTKAEFKLIDNSNQDENIYEFYVSINNANWEKVSPNTLYTINNSVNGNNIIETKTVDMFGRQSAINRSNYTYGSTSNSVNNNINNLINNQVNNSTTYNTINNSTNNASTKTNTNSGNNVDPNVKLNTITSSNTTNDTTFASKIIPKTGTEKTIGILLITSLISLFLYGKYIKFN